MTKRSLVPLALLASALLGACRDDGLTAPVAPVQPAPRVLGLVEITISGIGTPAMKATVSPLSGSAPSGGASFALASAPQGIQLGARTSSTLDAGGQRYVQAEFAVRNAAPDGTPSSVVRRNVTFVPVSTSATIAGTPISRFLRQDGSPANSAIAQQLRPTGAVVSNGAGGVMAAYADVLQAFTEAEVAAVSAPESITGRFPYGFVVRAVAADGSVNPEGRELAANPAVDQFDGAVTFAFRFPIQPSAADNPFSITIVAMALDDSETRVTQSVEEQTAAGTAAFEARALSLGATGVTVLPGGTYSGDANARMLCTLRTAGTADAPTVALGRATVVINEIMANPDVVADNMGEYFEVYNPCSAPVNLNGWRIASGGGEASSPHTIPSNVVVPAGGYAVLAINDVSATNGGFTANYKYASNITLANNTTDWLALRDASGASVDSVSWGAAPGDAASSPPAGASRALVSPLRNNLFLSGANSSWVTSPTTQQYGPNPGNVGTPGSANNVTLAVGPAATANVGPDFVMTAPGSTVQFSAMVRDASGNQVNSTLTWTTSDTGIATIDATGRATAVADGEVYVKAVTSNGVADSTKLQVFTEPSVAVYRDHLEFGKPLDADPASDTIVTKTQFVTSYSSVRGGPNWVSWNLNRSHFGYRPRCDCFSADNTTDIPAGVYRVVTGDYTSSGYTRGHMVRSEERTLTAADNQATFLMTNILPQTSELNSGPWGYLEFDAETMAKFRGKELYVLAGGLYGAAPATLKNEGKVQIPTHTWKIILILPAGKGLADVTSSSDVEVIAVSMPNTTNLLTPGFSSTPWSNYVTTVDQLEAATGYDFFSLLPDAIENELEARASRTSIP
jgi:DNA/RNA endonuclease G (NUC1)